MPDPSLLDTMRSVLTLDCWKQAEFFYGQYLVPKEAVKELKELMEKGIPESLRESLAYEALAAHRAAGNFEVVSLPDSGPGDPFPKLPRLFWRATPAMKAWAEGQQDSQADTSAAKIGRRDKKERGIAHALILVGQHPDWTNKDIAAKVGLDPSTLSRSPEFQRARQTNRAELPKGHVRVDPDTGQRDVEAYDR